MQRAMSVVLAGLVLAGSLQGCTGTSAATDRLGVTAALRQACSGATVEEIRTVIDTVELARLGGASRETTLAVFAQACGGDAASAGACMACTSAIIEQVYTE